MRKIMQGGLVREEGVTALTLSGETVTLLAEGQSISFRADRLPDVINVLLRVQADIQAEYTPEDASDVPYINALFNRLAKGA